jgi:hypothetical protein
MESLLMKMMTVLMRIWNLRKMRRCDLNDLELYAAA